MLFKHFNSVQPLRFLAVAGIVFACGLLWQNPSLLGGGAIGLCLTARGYENFSGSKKRRKQTVTKKSQSKSIPDERETPDTVELNEPRIDDPVKLLTPDPDSADGLVMQMLSQDRYALLLRPRD